MHSEQFAAFNSRARVIVIPAGRRWGKSETGVMWALRGAHDDRLAGIDGLTWWIEPTYDLNRPIWRKMIRIAPEGWITGKRGTEGAPDFLEFGPARLEFKSADHPERLVAEGLRRVVIDECGIVKELVWRESIMPTLIDHAAPAMLLGTPKGRNWFHAMTMRGEDPEDTEVERHGGPSWQNPFIPRTEVERLASEMPERLYRQEILAEFLDDEGAVFRGVRDCVGAMSKRKTRTLGVDLAKHHDFTVLIGLDDNCCMSSFDRFREISWPLQKERIIAAAKDSGAHVLLDSTGLGDPILDDLKKAGVDVEGYHFSNATKQQLIENLSIGLEQKRLTLADEPVVVNELEAYEYEVGRTGVVRYNAPEGAHDDCVIALALAYRAATAAGTGAGTWGR